MLQIMLSGNHLPNTSNTSVRTSTSIQLRRAGQQSPTRTSTAALKRSIKQLHNCYTGFKYYKQENWKKISLFNAIRVIHKFCVCVCLVDVSITYSNAEILRYWAHTGLGAILLASPSSSRGQTFGLCLGLRVKLFDLGFSIVILASLLASASTF